jgi:hypothetical protein
MAGQIAQRARQACVVEQQYRRAGRLIGHIHALFMLFACLFPPVLKALRIPLGRVGHRLDHNKRA